MTTVGQRIDDVRAMLRSSLSDDLTLLAEDYHAGDPTISLRYPRPNLGTGGFLSVGLNTFYVLETASGGDVITVMPSADGSPVEDALAGTIVRVRPSLTNWSIFREWCGALNALSSPDNGVYAYGEFDASPDFVNNTYYLPTTDNWPNVTPIALLKVRYQERGHNRLSDINGYQWQPEFRVVRIYGRTPNASLLRFTFSFAFTQPTSMNDTTASLGMSVFNDDIPTYGAANNLSLADEGMRNLLTSQGNPRRPSEVQSGANIGVSREFQRQWQERVMQEASRQIKVFGYRHAVGISGE